MGDAGGSKTRLVFFFFAAAAGIGGSFVGGLLVACGVMLLGFIKRVLVGTDGNNGTATGGANDDGPIDLLKSEFFPLSILGAVVELLLLFPIETGAGGASRGIRTGSASKFTEGIMDATVWEAINSSDGWNTCT